MTCQHELYEREVACADGMCPQCLRAEVERLRGLLTEWVADAHWNPRANLPDLVNRTKHAIGAARATDSATPRETEP